MAAQDLLERLKTACQGRYEIERELGRGGMATVYLAPRDLKHPRQVAIKVLKPELAAVVGPERFKREIETTASLTHPLILPIYDSGSSDGLLYYVMPFVEGESLRDRLRRERQLSLEEALQITREVADALDYAHRQDVLHRDIKPENILLSEGHAVLADFGIARAIQAAGGGTLTETGVLIGTPAYMSPEQASGHGHLDERSDLYSLGCVFYEMLAGQPPFRADTPAGYLHQHVEVEPKPLRALRPGVPETVEKKLARTLAKTPADRYPTAGMLAEALRVPYDVPLPKERWVPSRRWLAGAGVTIAAAAVVAVVAITGIVPIPGWNREGTVSAEAVPREWTWVADFEGPSDDPTLAKAVRNMVTAGLDQSGVVATVPRQQVKIALQMAQIEDTDRVDAELAQQLAYRSAIRTIVTGRIDRIGKGYSTALRVVDVERDSVLLVVSDVAEGEDELISCLTELTEELSQGLNERQGDVRQARMKIMAVTPSFDAYRKIIQAEGAIDSHDFQTGIDLFGEALELDPECAYAHMMTGYMYLNLRMLDSTRVAFERALRYPDRLTEDQLLLMEAQPPVTGTIETAISAREQVSMLNPNDASNWWNLGVCYMFAGRVEEAFEASERSREVSPVAPLPVHWVGLAGSLASMGNFDEARQIIESELEGGLRLSCAAILAAAEGDWDAQDSLATVIADPFGMASARAARGEIQAAMRILGQGQTAGSPGGSPDLLVASAYLRLTSQTEVESSDEISRPTNTAMELVANGLRAVSAGNLPEAREHLRGLADRRGELGYEGEDLLPLLEAWIAAREARWDSVIAIARPIATRHRQELSDASRAFAKPAARWLVATAYETMEQPDSAAFYYEFALSVYRLWPSGVMSRGLGSSFLHQRLVLVYAGMGRLDDARRHWESFSAAFTRPDPEVRHLLEEARAALANAEAMAEAEKG